MAPLPPDSTPRYRIHYKAIDKDHTFQLRSDQSPAFIGNLANDFFTALGAAVGPILLEFVDWAPAGSNVFNPVITGHEGAAYAGGAFTNEMNAWAYTFVGRSSGGKRTRIAVFGALFLSDDYRLEAAASPTIAAALNILNLAGSLITCIDGLRPVWKSYVDIQVNDHWVKNLRP